MLAEQSISYAPFFQCLTVALSRVQSKEIAIVYHGDDPDYMRSTSTSPKVTKKGLRGLVRPLAVRGISKKASGKRI